MNTDVVNFSSLCPSGKCQAVILMTDTAVNTSLPFDPAIAANYFAASFISAISLWLISLGVGQILRMLR